MRKNYPDIKIKLTNYNTEGHQCPSLKTTTMKRLHFLLLLVLTITLFTSCAPDSRYDEDIIHVYFNPSIPEELIISTSTLSNDSDYIVDNDMSSGYFVQMDETEDTLEILFVADKYIERLNLLQYIDSYMDTPFKELGDNHYLLKKPVENFLKPATGYYKFTVIRYN